ncbi:MAG: DegV family protein [Clostridia bacterium]|nr:DegV family protein [Clostridia bacterium]
MNYKIFTDSSSGLPKSVTEKYPLNVIPVPMTINGEEVTVKSDDDVFLKNFYVKLRENASMSTSCVNKQSFLNRFTPALESGYDVLYIGLSSGLSSTMQNACDASKELKEKFPARSVYIIDSLNAAQGEGMLVYLALLKQQEGFSAKEVYDYITSVRLNLNSLFTVKTLFYLAKGGRISKLSMTVGTVVDIKPIMHVDERGKLVAPSKVIGRKRSISQIAENFYKSVINPEEQTVFIGHGDCIDDAKYLAELISKKVHVKEFVFNYIDPIIAVHSGPDTLAVFSLGTSRVPENAFVNSVDYVSEAV